MKTNNNTITEKIITSSFEACGIIEGFNGEENTDEDVLAAFQYLIDTGDVWTLQGFYGRTAHQLIESGQCRHPLQ